MIHNSTDLHPFQPVADNCRICIRKINTNELDILWHKGKSEKLLKKEEFLFMQFLFQTFRENRFYKTNTILLIV